MSKEWKKSFVIPIFMSKGNIQKCGNKAYKDLNYIV